MVSRCLMPFHLLRSGHYYEPSSPQQPPMVCLSSVFMPSPSVVPIRYYSATILQMAGVRDDKQAIWLASATAATNFLFTLVGVWLVERVGRRKLTLGSLMGVCMCVWIFTFYPKGQLDMVLNKLGLLSGAVI